MILLKIAYLALNNNQSPTLLLQIEIFDSISTLPLLTLSFKFS